MPNTNSARLASAGIVYEAVEERSESFRVTARQGSTVLWEARVSAQIMIWEMTLSIDGTRLRLRIDGDHPKSGVWLKEWTFDAGTGRELP